MKFRSKIEMSLKKWNFDQKLNCRWKNEISIKNWNVAEKWNYDQKLKFRSKIESFFDKTFFTQKSIFRSKNWKMLSQIAISNVNKFESEISDPKIKRWPIFEWIEFGQNFILPEMCD